jgi:hypothetical protein
MPVRLLLLLTRLFALLAPLALHLLAERQRPTIVAGAARRQRLARQLVRHDGLAELVNVIGQH